MPSSDILLATLNAKFIHCAFGLRYLFANLGVLQPRAALIEFEIQQRPLDIVEQLLARQPRIVGLGVYIWNVRETTEVVELLKRLAPEVIVILGGPEVSYEWEKQEIVRLADHVITGEADLKFAEVCLQLLAEGENCGFAAYNHSSAEYKNAPTTETATPDNVARAVASETLPPPRKTEAAPVPPAVFPTPDAIFRTQNAILRPEEALAEAGGTVSAPASPALPSPLAHDPDPNPAAVAGTEGGGRGAGFRAREGLAVAVRLPKIIPAELPKLEDVALPYDLYTPHDLAHRVVYVEASRGCPFTCEFCLSSLDIPVRQFPLEPFLAAMDRLLARGATQFKFVDRTFNLNLMVSRAILQFFLARMRPGLFVHFEMVPDRLPEQLRAVITQFPAGSLQFEVGVQTFNEATSRNISRRQDHAKLAENLTWLRGHTGVHVHADLIVGLPGEDLASFARGFDRLVALGPQEIQVGILKRLRGTPIVRHDAEFALRYSGQPPYELLQNRDLDFPLMQRLRRFARYWDLVANSGNFRTSTPLLWGATNSQRTPQTALHSEPRTQNSEFNSPCWTFLAFSDWLYTRLAQRHGIALDALAESLFVYLTTVRGWAPAVVAATLLADFEHAGRRERPPFLKAYLPTLPRQPLPAQRATAPKRQAKHLPPAGTAP
ncbi:MAG: hypothetical protein RL514_3235 [Verrucomicrobiota bacterium]|jgi:radical SAM superfamily enzyme YgiQ (UPF0313 family)